MEIVVTMKAMCEHIAKARFLVKRDGSFPAAEEIFNYSPTGELYMIFTWYHEACLLIGEPEKS